MINNINSIDNVLTKEECNYLISVAEKTKQWEKAGSDFWDDRCLNVPLISKNGDVEAARLLLNIKDRIAEAITSLYKLDKKIYPDLLQIVRWFPGLEQSPHCDDMTDTDTEGLEWFKHRNFASVIYLNDDYVGGHTYYPQYNFEIIPKAGSMAIHPGTSDYMHGVTKIENKIRYTIASFWTFEKEYEYVWPIY